MMAEVNENGVAGATCQVDLQQRMRAQAEEALGEVNVYYYKLNNPWVLSPSPNQLLEWYIKNGGAVGYRVREIEYRKWLEQERRQREVAATMVAAQG